MVLLQKKLLYLRPCVSFLNTTFLSSSLRLLYSAVCPADPAGEIPPPTPPFSSKYLINSCGLSSERAARAYTYLSHLKSSSNPDAVLHFMKQIGLNAADIAATVSSDPKLLLSSVEKTMKPRTMELRDMGFSPTQIAQLVLLTPNSLRSRYLKCKVEILTSIFGTVDNLLRALRKNRYLLTSDLKKVLAPNISFLQECGFSGCDIAKLLVPCPRLITTSPESVRAAVQRAEELGVPRASRLFRRAVSAAFCLSRGTVNAKIELLKSLGWSQDVVSSVIRKAPMLLHVSEEKLRRNFEFLMQEGRCEPSYIALYPMLLTYSLKQRLIPRHYVHTILKSKSLSGGELSFFTTMVLSEKRFKERLVLPNEGSIPGLSANFDAFCTGRFPSEGEP